MSVFNRFWWTLVKSKVAANHHFRDIDTTLGDATHLEAHAEMHALNAREEPEIVCICTKYIMYCLYLTTCTRPFHVACVDGHFSKYWRHASLYLLVFSKKISGNSLACWCQKENPQITPGGVPIEISFGFCF